jgi:hypothetical protein
MFKNISLIQCCPAEIESPAQWKLIGRQNDQRAACVIAQQYSSVNFFSLRFQSPENKISLSLKSAGI